LRSIAERDVERLLRGVSTGHVQTVRTAFRALLREPAEALPAALAKLDRSTWEAAPRGPSCAFLAILLTLVKAIDVDAFDREAARLAEQPLDPRHRVVLDSIARRRSTPRALTVAGGVPVHVTDEIDRPQEVARHLLGWSESLDDDLRGVSRIDVVAASKGLDYLGQYHLHLSRIVLAWPVEPRRRLKRSDLDSLRFTYLHEVGHHALGHAEGGQEIDQEREADAYACDRIMAASPGWRLFRRFAPETSRDVLMVLLGRFRPGR